jgi:toxin YhaV
MNAPKSPVVINGWAVFAHPLFLDQLEALLAEVEQAKVKDPTGFIRKNCAKRLKMISDLAFRIIPADPTAREYRQGDALGSDRKHWFRAKFFQQYRLFFRYRQDARVLVYAWVNDEDTRRAYDSKTDAYAVFSRMLKKGRPPDDWDSLLAEAQATVGRLKTAISRAASP